MGTRWGGMGTCPLYISQSVLLVLEFHRRFLLVIREFSRIASSIGRDFSRITNNKVGTENTLGTNFSSRLNCKIYFLQFTFILQFTLVICKCSSPRCVHTNSCIWNVPSVKSLESTGLILVESRLFCHSFHAVTRQLCMNASHLTTI